MRVFIIDNPLLVNGDAILILICIFMTFYRMLTELFDSEGDCILTYDHLSADISEATSRVIMYFLGAWFDSYLTSKVYIYPFVIYIYNLESKMPKRTAKSDSDSVKREGAVFCGNIARATESS